MWCYILEQWEERVVSRLGKLMFPSTNIITMWYYILEQGGESVDSGIGKLMFPSGNAITMWCYILEQAEERAWGRKMLCFFYFQLDQCHLMIFNKAKWSNYIYSSFTTSIMGKCIFLSLIIIIIIFIDLISFSHNFFHKCMNKLYCYL